MRANPLSTPARYLSTRQNCQEELLQQVEIALEQESSPEFLQTLKSSLRMLAGRGDLENVAYPAEHPERYSRRLVHADPAGRFVVIAMTWRAGQYTALHDHAGLWCVELVARGEMEIIDYELLTEDAAGLCRFRRHGSVSAREGTSGGLIPPFEHHIFGNRGTATAHTLHLYGGAMKRCDIFEPVPGGFWQRRTRELRFDE